MKTCHEFALTTTIDNDVIGDFVYGGNFEGKSENKFFFQFFTTNFIAMEEPTVEHMVDINHASATAIS